METNINKRIVDIGVDNMFDIIDLLQCVVEKGYMDSYKAIAILSNLISGIGILDIYSVFGIKYNSDNSQSNIIKELSDLVSICNKD